MPLSAGLRPGRFEVALTLGAIVFASSAWAGAQFKRGMFSEATEITLSPLEAPALLLPAGSVQVDVRNASSASARIAERVQERITRQLTDNDSRLRVVKGDSKVIVVATITEWNESRRNSQKYVSETRQVGTKQVVKDGKTKTEPVYEYGRNRPSVVINATAGLRVEVRTAGGTMLADETTRHAIREEYLVEAGPPSRDQIEDQLIDNLAQKGAGRISPGRLTLRVMLARSDEVDRLNGLAQNRRWDEWLGALSGLPAHRDPKKDAYRLHNLAVANEAIAYEATDPEDWTTRLGRATALVTQSAAANPKEKYITDAAARIARSVASYQRLAELYRGEGAKPAAAPPPARAAREALPQSAPVAAKAPPTAMTNQDVIELRAAGLDDDNLIAAIKEAKEVQFDLSAAGLKTLLAGKVSNKVIAVMRARKQ